MAITTAVPCPVPFNHKPTLAELLERLPADTALSSGRQRDIASALRTFGKALGKPLDELPADPSALRGSLKGFVAAMAGLSDDRWRNVLSLVRGALKRAGLTQVPGRSTAPISAAWLELLDPSDRRTRFALSRLARYCSGRQIDPTAIDDTVLADFLQAMEKDSLLAKPRQIHRTACLVWNKSAASVAGWPQRVVTLPDYRRTYALPWDTFPASLKVDLDAYLDRQAGNDVLADFDRKPLRPLSLRNQKSLLHRFASALVHRGRDPATLTSLQDLVAIDAAKQGLYFLAGRVEGKTAQAWQAAGLLQAVAEHWVRVDAAHLTELKRFTRRLTPERSGLTAKNNARLRQFDDPANVDALLALPQRIFAKAARAKPLDASVALEVQAALAVELLTMLPLRISNLAQLDLERHLIRTRRGHMHLSIPGSEVKNSSPIEALLPASTVKMIELYVNRYRKFLITRPTTCLFPGHVRPSKCSEQLGRLISRSVKRHCGLLMNPHLFRHLSAKLFLSENPGAYGVLRLLHGHKSVETTARFYCGSETQAAIKHYDDHVLERRKTPRRPKSGSR